MAQRTSPRLYLITPPVGDPTAFARELESVLSAGDIAAVLLRLAEADERTLISRIKTIAPVVQRGDIAFIVDGRADLAVKANADGAHLTGTDAFAAALALLKPDRIAGAGGLQGRHDAMLAGETGADYVMFGEPPPPFPPPRAGEGQGGGRRLPFDELLERLEWWAGLVEIPCVGYAASLDEIEALARTGAEFIALGEWIWTDPQGAAATVAAATATLAAMAR